MSIDLSKLKEAIESRWRVQSFSSKSASCQCVPYVDSRDVQNRLDEVCGPENWQDKYKDVKGNVYCSIGIRINNEWIWKEGCGVESNVEKEKGEESDSFKRAAVKWGIGRFLYDTDLIRIRANEKKQGSNKPYPIDDKNNRIWDLTAYINNLNSEKDKKPSWWVDAVNYMLEGGDIERIKLKYKITKNQERCLTGIT